MKKYYKKAFLLGAAAVLCAGCILSGCFRRSIEPESSAPGDTSVNAVDPPGRLVSDFGSDSSQESESAASVPEMSSENTEPEQSEEYSGVSAPEESPDYESSLASEEGSDRESEVSSRPADSSDIDGLEQKYFVRKLSPKLLSAFANLYRAAKNFETEVEFEKPLDDDELTTLMFLLNYDCPELIQLNGDYYPDYIDTTMMLVGGVRLSMNLNEDEYNEGITKLSDFFKELKKDTKGMSELEKELYVYDMIFDSCIYDEYDRLSGSAYGVLIGNRGRCEGYSKSFLWCMRELGVECMCVSGSQNWDSSARFAEHSWDIVRIDGNYYHLDITVDNVQLDAFGGNPANYGFFNVTDEDISQNRTIRSVYTDLGVPVCDSTDANYHIMNDMYVYKEQSLKDSLYTALENNLTDEGVPPFSLKFESEETYNDMVENADEIIKQYFNENTEYIYDFTKYTNNLSRTLVLQAERKEDEEE